MPEGHTAHRLARDLRELAGAPLRAASPQGRFAEGAALLDGATLRGTEAYGKHVLLEVAAEVPRWLHVHLGMQGKWFRYPDPTAAPMRQVRLRLATDAVAWDLIAPSTCELLAPAAVERLVAGLGPDPLRPDADRDAAVAGLAAAPGPIGAAVLDQSLVAGVGNVFRAEALHAIGVDPRAPARSLDRTVLERLWEVLRRMMAQAVEDGRIVTVEADDRLAVPEAESRRVYKQERCRDCGAPVAVEQVGGRTSYRCVAEQGG